MHACLLAAQWVGAQLAMWASLEPTDCFLLSLSVHHLTDCRMHVERWIHVFVACCHAQVCCMSCPPCRACLVLECMQGVLIRLLDQSMQSVFATACWCTSVTAAACQLVHFLAVKCTTAHLHAHWLGRQACASSALLSTPLPWPAGQAGCEQKQCVPGVGVHGTSQHCHGLQGGAVNMLRHCTRLVWLEHVCVWPHGTGSIATPIDASHTERNRMPAGHAQRAALLLGGGVCPVPCCCPGLAWLMDCCPACHSIAAVGLASGNCPGLVWLSGLELLKWRHPWAGGVAGWALPALQWRHTGCCARHDGLVMYVSLSGCQNCDCLHQVKPAGWLRKCDAWQLSSSATPPRPQHTGYC